MKVCFDYISNMHWIIIKFHHDGNIHEADIKSTIYVHNTYIHPQHAIGTIVTAQFCHSNSHLFPGRCSYREQIVVV